MLNRPLRVLLLTEHAEHASSDLRGFAPLKVLEEANLIYTGVHHLREVISDDPKEVDENDPESPLRRFSRDLSVCDLILIPQTSALGWNKFIKTWQDAGKVVVIDTDDDVRYVSPLSPTYETRGVHPVWARAEVNGVLRRVPLWEDGKKGFNITRNKEWQNSYWAGLTAADAVTCPTERYATELKRFCNPNAFALPNCLDLDLWKPGRHTGRVGFRICWHGGDSHRMDVGDAAKGVGMFLKSHPEATFVLMGAPLQEWVAEVPPAQMEFWDWASYDAHPWRLQALSVSVGLCPVINHKFNDAKSPLKWAEFAACGVPSICSMNPPYLDAVKDGEDGILVRNEPERWLEALEWAWNHPTELVALGVKARERVERDYDIYKQAHLWYELYKRLIEEKQARKVEAA